MVFKQNTDTFIQFKTDGKMYVSRYCLFSSVVGLDINGSLSMVRAVEGDFKIFQFSNTFNTLGMYRFKLGSDVMLDISKTLIQSTRILQCDAGIKTNTINTNGDNNLLLQRNSSTYLTLNTDKVEISQPLHLSNELVLDTSDLLKMKGQLESGNYIFDIRNDQALNSMIRFRIGGGGVSSIIMQVKSNEVVVSQDIVMASTKSIKTDIIDTPTDTDLLIRRNGTDVLNIFTYSPTNGPSIIVNAQSDCGISSSWLFANVFANRTSDTDTEFRGAISGGLDSGKVYMTYKHITEILDVDCHIDATGYDITGNLINTGVSDKRLKTNIQDIDDANYSDCVKNVKLKTFEFKDTKFDNQDKYGMIAQELQENLPKEFKSIVRQNIPKKDGGKEYLSINYMKLSVVLWGCCQEQQSKIEHLESRLFELEDIVKEMRGKKTTKPKAKAKSKVKSEK